jgi:hypothetical protein
VSTLRQDCYWFLRYGGRPYCKKQMLQDPTKAPSPLDLGCPADCGTFEQAPWRKPPPAQQVQELEWDDVADEDDELEITR